MTTILLDVKVVLLRAGARREGADRRGKHETRRTAAREGRKGPPEKKWR